jgi:hypothetical protein
MVRWRRAGFRNQRQQATADDDRRQPVTAGNAAPARPAVDLRQVNASAAHQ